MRSTASSSKCNPDHFKTSIAKACPSIVWHKFCSVLQACNARRSFEPCSMASMRRQVMATRISCRTDVGAPLAEFLMAAIAAMCSCCVASSVATAFATRAATCRTMPCNSASGITCVKLQHLENITAQTCSTLKRRTYADKTHCQQRPIQPLHSTGLYANQAYRSPGK